MRIMPDDACEFPNFDHMSCLHSDWVFRNPRISGMLQVDVTIEGSWGDARGVFIVVFRSAKARPFAEEKCGERAGPPPGGVIKSIHRFVPFILLSRGPGYIPDKNGSVVAGRADQSAINRCQLFFFAEKTN
jgi:hypothetical protein